MRHGPVYAAFFFLVNRDEHQQQTQTATKWWPFGFVFGVQLGSLQKRKRGVPSTCRTVSNDFSRNIFGASCLKETINTKCFRIKIIKTFPFVSMKKNVVKNANNDYRERTLYRTSQSRWRSNQIYQSLCKYQYSIITIILCKSKVW